MTDSFLKIIKMDADKARRAGEKDKATSLMTLYSEAYMKGKNRGNRETTDDEVLDMIQVFVKNIDALLEHPCNADFREKAKIERELLSSYLPEKLTEEQLVNMINSYTKKLEITSIGQVMKWLKETVPNQYDSKQASTIARSFLS